jgi:predicted acylesterase/phospholipase RssA
MNEYPFEVVVFSGGGFRAFAHIGALKAIEETGRILDGITTFVGTSSGALVAAYAAYGLTADEIYEEAINIDITSMFKLSARALLKDSALYDVSKFREYLARFFGDTTLADLHERSGKHVAFVVYDATACTVRLWSSETTPAIKVSDALYTSCAIPIMFPTTMYDGHVYYDGGAIDNFPVRYYKDKHTLGIRFANAPGNYSLTTCNDGISRVVKSFIQTASISASAFDEYHEGYDSDRLLYVINLPVDPSLWIKFSMSDATKRRLFDIGHLQTELKLSTVVSTASE